MKWPSHYLDIKDRRIKYYGNNMGYLNWCQETLVNTPTEWMLNCCYFSHVPHIQPIWSLQQYNIMTRVWVDLWPHLKTHNEFGKINYIPLLNQLFVSLVPRAKTKASNKLSTLPYPRSVYLELGNKSLNLIVIIIMVRCGLGNCIKIWVINRYYINWQLYVLSWIFLL